MDGLDHSKKNGSSGHDSHGAHVCHKCGWPFPNPHPSAKHRRTHKKVCGTIEGYKLNESDAHQPHLAVSDDEHTSDEDHQTPSPKIEKTSMKDLASGSGVGGKSNVSEDEVFTDADTEFLDSGVSPAMEESVRDLSKDMEKLLKADPNKSQLITADVSADDTKESSKEVLDIAKDQSESGKSSCGTRSEEFPVESHAIVGSKSSIKSEIPTDVLIDETTAKMFKGTEQEPVVNENDVYMDESLTTSGELPHGKAARDISELELNLEEQGKQTLDALTQESLMHKVDEERKSELEEPKRKSSDCVTLEDVTPKPVTTDYKLPEGSSFGIVEQKKDESDEVEANMGKNGTSPLFEQKKDEIDSAADDGSGYSKIVEAYGQREEGENDMQGGRSEKESEEMRVSCLKEQKEKDIVCYLSEAEKDELLLHRSIDQKEATSSNSPEEEKQYKHSQSVANSLPLVHNVETVIEGLKDNNTSESTLPLDDLGSAGVMTSVYDYSNATVAQAGHRSLHSGDSSGSIESSSANTGALKHDPDEKDVEGFAGVMTLVQDDSIAAIAQAGHPGLHSGDSNGSIESSSADRSTLKHDPDEKAVEKSVVRKDDISGVGNHEDDRSCGIESLPDAPRTETQNIQTDNSYEGLHLYSIDNEALRKAHSEDATADKLEIKSMVLVEEVEQVTSLHKGENADNNEASKSEKCDTARNETSKEHLEDELSTNKNTMKEHAGGSFITADNQTIGSLKVSGNLDHDRAPGDLLDIARCESTEVGGGKDLVKNTEAAHDATGQLSESTDLDTVSDKFVNARENIEQTYSSLCKCADESSEEASHGFGTSNITDVLETANFTAKDIEVNRNGSLLASNENSEDSTSKEAESLHVESEPLNKSSAAVELTHTRGAVKHASDCNSKPSQDEGDHRFEKQLDGDSAIDMLVSSSSRTDSLECNWGSVSVVSTQSDTTATADAGGFPFSVSQPPEKSAANLQMPKDASNECHPDKLDVHERSSLVTLAEAGDPVFWKAAPEIQTAQAIKQPKPGDLQAGSFLSPSNAVNGSQGRKNNDEIIAEVSNRSTEKQHHPLKKFLSEAKSPDTEQVPNVTRGDAPLTKGNGAAVATVNAILHAEEPNDLVVNKDMEKEWNSPARYPSQIKKERKKGRPYWVAFVCCSSVHRDF